DVNVGAQRLQPFLVLDAEMLLFINNHKAQIAKLHLLAEDRMGADDDLDLSRLEAALGLRGVLDGDHARELTYAPRPALETFGEGAEVLTRQQRGRTYDRDLLTAHGDHERGA